MSGEQNNDSNGLTSQPIESYQEFKADQVNEAAKVQQAISDYLDAGKQYGGGRSLYAPEGRYVPNQK